MTGTDLAIVIGMFALPGLVLVLYAAWFIPRDLERVLRDLDAQPNGLRQQLKGLRRDVEGLGQQVASLSEDMRIAQINVSRLREHLQSEEEQ